MEDKDLLMWLRSGDRDALEAIIDQYTAYVTTVVRNQFGHTYDAADVEELVSTVFFTLWRNRCAIVTPHLRGWLGTVAKNQTRSFLRKQKRSDSTVSLDDDKATELLEVRERARILKIALLELGEPDSEIMRRYYFLEETVSSIARRLDMHPEAIKSRLRRGRGKLKEILRKEGYEQ